MNKATEGGPPAVAWFRQDLRQQDHAALQAALAGRHTALSAYVLDADTPGAWMPKPARLPERFMRAPWSAPPAARRPA